MNQRLPTEEDVLRLKKAEADALADAQAVMQEFQAFVEGMSEPARADMDPNNEEVQQYVLNRDRASAARVRYEQLRSERASAEPMIRYQAFMEEQRTGDLPLSLPHARLIISRVNYANAYLGEFEALSVMMLQGPQALEQYDAAREQTQKWKGEYIHAQRVMETNGDSILNPMSMTPFEPEQSEAGADEQE